MSIRVKERQISAERYSLAMYDGDTYIGEYEDSIKSNIPRKKREIAKAENYLLDLYKQFMSPLRVRWVAPNKVVRCDVNGDDIWIEVGQLPKPWE